MPVGAELGWAVPNQHAHVVRALITSAGESESPSPYVVLRLAEHVAEAGAWDDLAAARFLLADEGPSLLSLVGMTVNGRSLLGAGGPRGIRLWNLESSARIDLEAVDSERPVRVLAVLPQPGGAVVLAGADPGGAVQLWRVHP